MIAHRLQGIPPTIFGEMSALAARTGSVNLGQGFPDEDGPGAVIEAAARAMRDGANQYPPAYGVPALREAVLAHQQRCYGYTPQDVVVTTGATEALAGAILGLVEPGDGVVMLEPYYDSYLAMVQVAGGVRRPVTLSAPDFRLDEERLRSAAAGARFLLLDSPPNPTGAVLSRDELEVVARVAAEHDLTVISDEVYEHLTYDAPHVPIATLPGMAERTLTISSIGKSYSLTGWKVGWASGPAALVQAVYAAKQWLSYVSGGPLQPAAAYALTELPDWPSQLAQELAGKRDQLVKALNEAGLPTSSPSGTYFAVSDISHLGWEDGLAFCRALPERAGVVGIPLQGFYDADDRAAGRHLVRWAFCKRPEVIAEAASRLAGAHLEP